MSTKMPNPVLSTPLRRRRRRQRQTRYDAALSKATTIDDERGNSRNSNSRIMLRQMTKGMAMFIAGSFGTGVTAFSAVCGVRPKQRPQNRLDSTSPHLQSSPPQPPPIMVPSPSLLGVAPALGTRQFLEDIISGQEAAAASGELDEQGQDCDCSDSISSKVVGLESRENIFGRNSTAVGATAVLGLTDWGGAGGAFRLKEEPTTFVGRRKKVGAEKEIVPSAAALRDVATRELAKDEKEEQEEGEEDTGPYRVLRRRHAAVPAKKPKPKHGYRRSANKRTQAIHDSCAELCQTDLLTRAEEYELGTKIQVLMRRTEARRQLAARLGRPSSWAEWAESCGTTVGELKESMRVGEESKKTMVEANMRMVISIARKYRHYGVPLTDLIQEGSLGLVRAVEKFDPERGFKLSTYSAWWIQQAVFKGIAHQSRTIRLPVHVHNLLNSVRRAQRDLATSKGKEPSDHQVAGHLDIPVQRLQRYLELTKESVSFEMPAGVPASQPAKQRVLGDTLVAKDRGHPEMEGDALLFRTRLRELVEELSEDERIVLSLRFGLADGKRKSLRQIADIVRTPQPYVRRIESAAMRKLRSPEQTRRLRDFTFNSACCCSSSSSGSSSRVSFDGLWAVTASPSSSSKSKSRRRRS